LGATFRGSRFFSLEGTATAAISAMQRTKRELASKLEEEEASHELPDEKTANRRMTFE